MITHGRFVLQNDYSKTLYQFNIFLKKSIPRKVLFFCLGLSLLLAFLLLVNRNHNLNISHKGRTHEKRIPSRDYFQRLSNIFKKRISYIKLNNTDERSYGDFSCPATNVKLHCVFYVHSLLEATHICTHIIKLCKGFVWALKKNEDGLNPIFLKNNISVTVKSDKAHLYIQTYDYV